VLIVDSTNNPLFSLNLADRRFTVVPSAEDAAAYRARLEAGAGDHAALAARLRSYITPHPSRTAPRCVDCKFISKDDPLRIERICLHPAQPVSMVTGHAKASCSTARSDEAARLKGLAVCGLAGALFEPLVQPVTPGFEILSGGETAPITLTAADAAQARWLPGAGPDLSTLQPASPPQAPAAG
jgi:hypothetical protein